MFASLVQVRIVAIGHTILNSAIGSEGAQWLPSAHRTVRAILTQASFRSLIGFPSPGIPSSSRSGKFLRAPLPLSIHSLLSGLLLDFHQQAYDHAGHTSVRRRRTESWN